MLRHLDTAAVLVLIPGLVVALLAAVVFADEVRLLRERSALVSSVEVVAAMSDVAHHLQAERGTSNTYRQTEGAQLADTLPGLREATDQAYAAAEVALEEACLGEDVQASLHTVLDRRSEVDQLRSGVDSMRIDPADVVPGYTAVVQEVLGAAGPVVRATSDGDVARDLVGAVQVSYAKETAGLQRAQLASAFAADQFAPGQSSRIAGLVGERAAFLHSWTVVGGDEATARLEELTAMPEAQQVEEITQDALSRQSDFGRDSKEWFALATEYVDALREIEQDGYAQVAADTRDALGAAQLRFAVTAALLVAGALGIWAISRRTTRTVSADVAAIDATLAEVRAGRLDARAQACGTAEIARMAQSLNSALESVEGAMARISNASGRLRTSPGELDTVAADLSSTAASSSTQVGEASRKTAGVSTSLGAISSSGDELREAIVEISRSTAEVQRIVEEAVDHSSSAVVTLAELGESSTRIGQVLKTVGEISEQTNLLALNATIEAARAGEAGKGFAVVASEVKELSRATTEATEDIAERIEALRRDTDAATRSIERVTATITRVEELQATIAAAVEEQSATTAGIVDNVVDSARSSEDITARMTSVAAAAAQTDASADAARAAAHALVSLSEELDGVVEEFQLTARP